MKLVEIAHIANALGTAAQRTEAAVRMPSGRLHPVETVEVGTGDIAVIVPDLGSNLDDPLATAAERRRTGFRGLAGDTWPELVYVEPGGAFVATLTGDQFEHATLDWRQRSAIRAMIAHVTARLDATEPPAGQP